MSIYYQDDLVTLYHGDCLEHPEWWTGADVLVTDPPYGISWDGVASYSKGMRSDRKTSRNGNPIAGDNDLSARDKVLEIWGPNRAGIVFGTWKRPRPQNTRHRLIWWKRGQCPGPANSAFMTQDEEIYILGEGWKKTAPPMRSVIETHEARSIEVQKIGHPTPKPVALMEILIERCPPPPGSDCGSLRGKRLHTRGSESTRSEGYRRGAGRAVLRDRCAPALSRRLGPVGR